MYTHIDVYIYIDVSKQLTLSSEKNEEGNRYIWIYICMYYTCDSAESIFIYVIIFVYRCMYIYMYVDILPSEKNEEGNRYAYLCMCIWYMGFCEIHFYICKCIYICVEALGHLFLHLYLYIHIYIFISKHMYMYIHKYRCLYIQLYM
jgi:hypothetical protein